MKTVFTNGVFDLLHPQHINLLRLARSLGDELIVGINSDASARRLKGEGRPFFPYEYRAAMLYGVRWVDKVYRFDEDTPEELIAILKPAVLVKGADYDPETVAGRESAGEIKIVYSGDWWEPEIKRLKERVYAAGK